MEGAAIGLIFVVFFVIAVGIWAFSMSLDKSRITAYVQERGGRIVSISWAPFGKGWFGEKNERIYEVVYYDHEGNQHFATAKTSMFTGVFWTEDRITHGKARWYADLEPGNQPGRPVIRQLPVQPEEHPEDELRRLREENARLRDELAGRGRSSDAIQPAKCPACGAPLPPGAPPRCPRCGIALI
jgi:hypothetical protein